MRDSRVEHPPTPPYPPASVALSRIRIRHRSCFVVVAQERTLARAAQRLHLSQPAVSKTLSELERLAGRQLVQRGRAGTRLTPAGGPFLKDAADVPQAMDSAAAALAGNGPPDGPAPVPVGGP